MRARRSIPMLMAAALLSWGQAPVPNTLDAVAQAMGASAVRAIEYSGSGYTFAFQQAPGPGEPWPLFVADTYKVLVDYTTPAMRVESTRAQGEKPPRGGAGQPVAGNPRTIQFVSGATAWSQNAAGRAQANPAAVSDRKRQLWSTPHGLVKAAQAANVRMNGRTFALTLEGQRMTVTVGRDGLIEHADYLIDNPVLGDVPVQLAYRDYKDFNGIKFPTRIIEKTDGFLTLDIAIREVTVNPAAAIAPPAGLPTPAPAAPRPAVPRVDAVQIADGVWQLTASGYSSMLIEFGDHLAMFEAPLDDARSAAVNAWAKERVPSKPLRYVINTHAHFDHAGGLRAYAADGITIVTHEMNRSYYEQVWDRPRTMKPDRLAQNPRVPQWDTMTDRKTLTDGRRTLELYKLNNGHNPYIVIGYLPAEKILLYGDMYNPPPGDDPRDPARTNEFAEALYDDIVNRFRIDVQTMVPVHGRAVPFDNLRIAIGRDAASSRPAAGAR